MQSAIGAFPHPAMTGYYQHFGDVAGVTMLVRIPTALKGAFKRVRKDFVCMSLPQPAMCAKGVSQCCSSVHVRCVYRASGKTMFM